MSFFEDGEEPPTRAQPRPRPRRPASGGGRPPRSRTARAGRPPGGGGGGTPTSQDLLVRRAVAGGVALLVVLLLFFVVKGCADSRKERALKDYNRDAGQVAGASATQVAGPFFKVLNDGGGDLVNRINDLRQTSEEEVKTARNLDVPSQMKRAQQSLELVLDLRTTALEKIAALVPGARSDNAQTAEDAVDKIAGQMQQFLASDVIYAQRTQPYIAQALDDADVARQPTTASRSLPSLAWLQVDNVAGVLGAKRLQGGTGSNPKPAAGLHGHGLQSTTVGDTTLNTAGTNELTTSSDPTFEVKLQNQGDNDERDVGVKVTVKPGTGRAVTATKRVNQTKAGAVITVPVPLGAPPPFGEPSTVTVTVLKVPGEKNTDNNTQRYIALFKRG